MSKFIKYVYMFVFLLPMGAWADCVKKPLGEKASYSDDQYLYFQDDKIGNKVSSAFICRSGECAGGTTLLVTKAAKIGNKDFAIRGISDDENWFGVAKCEELGISGKWVDITDKIPNCPQNVHEDNNYESFSSFIENGQFWGVYNKSPWMIDLEEDFKLFSESENAVCKHILPGCPLQDERGFQHYIPIGQFTSGIRFEKALSDNDDFSEITEPNENLVATWEYSCKITGRTYNIIARPKECIKDYDLDTNTYRCVKKGGAGGDDDTDDVVIGADGEQTMGHKPAKKGPKMSVETAKNTLKKFFDGAKGNASVWRTEEGNFNGSRLAADLTAGVVLGTVGGVVSSNIIKKNQIKSGFEVLHCTIGGQTVADWGDEFNAGLQR